MRILENDSSVPPFSEEALKSEKDDVLIVSHKNQFDIGKLFKQAQSPDGELHD